jgi:2-hydroxy-3-keto-5-methylthiopentenyl-1-phosphate phosphatase
MMRSLEMMSAEGLSWKNSLCGSRMMMLGKQSTMQNFGTMLQTVAYNMKEALEIVNIQAVPSQFKTQILSF